MKSQRNNVFDYSAAGSISLESLSTAPYSQKSALTECAASSQTPNPFPLSRRFRCLSPLPLFWAASSWSSCPSGRRRSNAWSAAASFSPASPPTSWATSGRNPVWSRKCWVSAASQLFARRPPPLAPLHLVVKVTWEYWPKGVYTSEGGSRVFSPHLAALARPAAPPPTLQVEEKQARLTLWVCFLLRNLHHVLSEDLHVCSWGEGAAGGGWVKASELNWATGRHGSMLSSTLACNVYIRWVVIGVQTSRQTRDSTGRWSWQQLLEGRPGNLAATFPFCTIYCISASSHCLFHALVWHNIYWKVLEDHYIVFKAASNEVKWPKST